MTGQEENTLGTVATLVPVYRMAASSEDGGRESKRKGRERGREGRGVKRGLNRGHRIVVKRINTDMHLENCFVLNNNYFYATSLLLKG